MNNQNHSQLELFSQLGKDAKSAGQEKQILLWQVRGHEKAIIGVILFMLTGIISFCLGVERGKKIAYSKPLYRPEMAKVILPKPGIPIAVTNVKNDPQPVLKPALLPESYNYTIQVASYKTKVSAQKEASQLKKKGFSASISTKGKYIVLYAGRFTTKEQAFAVSAELKKQYRDCIIRRM